MREEYQTGIVFDKGEHNFEAFSGGGIRSFINSITYLMIGSRVQARFFVHIWRREAESDMIQRIWLEPDDPRIKLL